MGIAQVETLTRETGRSSFRERSSIFRVGGDSSLETSLGSKSSPLIVRPLDISVDLDATTMRSVECGEREGLRPKEEHLVSNSIYFRKDPISPQLRIAIQSVDAARQVLGSAVVHLSEGELKDADELVVGFKAKLPDFLCCTDVSESFGYIVNAIQNALENRRGVPLEKEHFGALDALLVSLIREPNMSVEDAVRNVIVFEDAGFDVESDFVAELIGAVFDS